MKLVSWNVAGKKTRAQEMMVALCQYQPDIIALQEVIASSRETIRQSLSDAGLHHATDSFELYSESYTSPDRSRHGELIASRFPIRPMLSRKFDVPWPERIVSVEVNSPLGEIELHNVHIPAGATWGLKKVETLEGLYAGLAFVSDKIRILCGDFNTPEEEHTDGMVVPFGDGRQRRAELSVLRGLARFDLSDVYRKLHGYERQDYSWRHPRHAPTGGRRFDHIFASEELCFSRCEYLHDLRYSGLSDHSAVEAVFEASA